MKHGELTAAVIAAAPKMCRLFSSPTGGFKTDRSFYRFGLVKGAADIIGWTKFEVMITDIVGVRDIAIFTAIEVKAGKDKLRPEQRTFLTRVAMAGGIAGVARAPEDAGRIIAAYFEGEQHSVWGVDDTESQ